jgi:DNA topoisomerase-1
MKNLVIVESPTKAKTISRFLGSSYEIKSSMGHIIDLPKSTLGVEVDGEFDPQYEVIKDKKKIITELKKAAKEAKSIILATDPDREGEAISAHIRSVLLEDKKLKIKSSDFTRIAFHEITKEAISHALENPGNVNEHLVSAQTARRVLDRLVGYKLSPLLWQKVRRGLSAGRVQSVALRLIVEREREIEKFSKQPFFTISASLENNRKNKIIFELIEINNEKIEIQNKYDLYDGVYTVTKTNIDQEEKAKAIAKDLNISSYIVSNITQKEVHRSPQAPYTTSSLQQDASRRLGLTGRRTMSTAQKLYEEGYITYHRTDSTAIAGTAQKSIITYITKEFGDKYLPPKPRFYASKQKNAQEAHEAIRPTNVKTLTAQVASNLGPQFAKLYELIWKRTIASQMANAIIESTSVTVDASGGADKYKLKANGSVLVFDGFLKINPQALVDNRLPAFKAGENLILDQAKEEFHETPPPPRYNDASLIKTLEEESIGRPSTYASIIGTIESRAYISRENNRFSPTYVGIAVNDFLVKNFAEIDDIPFTAEMENSLDLIADGKKEWKPMIQAFYAPFKKKLEEVKNTQRVKIAVEETEEKCSECAEGKLVIRTGRFGKFLSCNRFPECKFTKPLIEETNIICPKDSGKIIIRKTRKGRKFFGCSNYPSCDFASWKLEDINKTVKAEVKK